MVRFTLGEEKSLAEVTKALLRWWYWSRLHVGVWRKSIPGRRAASAKALRQECADVFMGPCGGLDHSTGTGVEVHTGHKGL